MGASLPATLVVGGASNVPVLELNVSNQSGETVQLTGVTLSAEGTGVNSTGVVSLSVYEMVGGSPVLLGTVPNPFASSTTPTISLPSLNVPPTSTQTFLVTYNFSTTAAAGTYTVGIANAGGLTGQGLTSGKSLNVTGTPVSGAVVTVAVSTATATSTSTVTATSTITSTGTPTRTKTPGVVKTPVLYPNPSTGEPISVYVPGSGIVDGTVEIFTTAFRKVQVTPFKSVPLGVVGNGLMIYMTDKDGTPLASGVYYAVVNTTPLSNSGGAAQRLIGKFLLLR